jgi:hypothetical protein
LTPLAKTLATVWSTAARWIPSNEGDDVFIMALFSGVVLAVAVPMVAGPEGTAAL